MYLHGYRETLSGYEYARWIAIAHTVRQVLKFEHTESLLDYGSGSGLHIELWKTLFPEAKLDFCDISSVALDKLSQKYPEYKHNCYLVNENKAQITGEQKYDVITSIEVMEHVDSLEDYFEDIKRLLKPGGIFIWTTPCANRFSIEHIHGVLTGQIEKTSEGFIRWKWEDPTHLRRLKSNQIRQMLEKYGFRNIGFRFRSHFFSFVCTKLCTGKFQKFGEKAMMLDYTLFRRLPNAASMIGFAQKG